MKKSKKVRQKVSKKWKISIVPLIKLFLKFFLIVLKTENRRPKFVPNISSEAGAIVVGENRVFCRCTHGQTLVTFEMWLSGLRGAPAGRNKGRTLES